MAEKNKLEKLVEKIGPMKCLIGGLGLAAFNYYFRYYKAGVELYQGDYWHAVKKFLLFFPVGLASDLLLAGGGYVEAKRLIKSYKKLRRARRLYNAWKNA